MTDLNLTPLFDATVLDRGILPERPTTPTRPLGGVHTRHTLARWDRPDVRVMPLTGPQSPGEAW